MDHLPVVDLFQRVHDRDHDGHHFFHREPPVLLHVLLEINALHILHDDVGRVVLGKIVVHGDEILLTGVFCHILGFPEEVVHALLVQPYRIVIAVDLPRYGDLPSGQRIREVFLDRDVHVELEVRSVISNAESALADHAVDPVLPVQDRPRGQIDRVDRHAVLCQIVRLRDTGTALGAETAPGRQYGFTIVTYDYPIHKYTF